MSKTFKISIPSPCHEKWQNMTPAEKGRFCASCQKVVHDFTQSSDREIASVLAIESNACGRFLNTQLDRDLVIPKEKSTIWMAASAAVVSFLSPGADAAAQNPVATEQQFQKDQIVKGKVALPSTQSAVISGTVVDETGLSLPGANVIIKGTETTVQTDFDGKYSINAVPGDTLTFSFISYRTVEVIVNECKELNIAFEIDPTHEFYTVGFPAFSRPSLIRRMYNGFINLFR